MADKIKELIKQMEDFAEKQQYEEAQKTLVRIKDELVRTKDLSEKYGKDWKPFLKEEPTIQNTYDIITGHSIRLNPEQFKFSDFLGLLSDVTTRFGDVQKHDDTKIRKIVAEEMVCKGMTIPQTYKGKKPNRAFLDIAYTVNPYVCKSELERREKVKLWKAIESGDKDEINKTKKEVYKYHS